MSNLREIIHHGDFCKRIYLLLAGAILVQKEFFFLFSRCDTEEKTLFCTKIFV